MHPCAEGRCIGPRPCPPLLSGCTGDGTAWNSSGTTSRRVSRPVRDTRGFRAGHPLGFFVRFRPVRQALRTQVTVIPTLGTPWPSARGGGGGHRRSSTLKVSAPGLLPRAGGSLRPRTERAAGLEQACRLKASLRESAACNTSHSHCDICIHIVGDAAHYTVAEPR